MSSKSDEWSRPREGFVRCICPISAGRSFNVDDHLEGIRIAFSRQGLHEFNPDDLVIERNTDVWKNEYSGDFMDIVTAFHPAL